MSTAVFDVARSIPARIQELNRLTKLASELEEKDENSYNTLCRACCVLLAAHLEGFIKELGQNLILDLNFNVQSFSKMPAAMQRTFCEKIAFYQGVEQVDIEQRIKQLITFFSSQNVTIDLDAFTYKENRNRNPGPDVIESAFAKLGVPSMIQSISDGVFDSIFKNDTRLSFILRRDIRRFQSLLYNFPYKLLPESYKFNYKIKPKQGGGAGLWQTFIEEMMRRRHTIAHGDTVGNETNPIELNGDIEKLEVLMYAMLYSSTTYLCKSYR